MVCEAFSTTYPFRKPDADRTNTKDVTQEIQSQGKFRWYVMKSKHDVVHKDGVMKAGTVAAALLYEEHDTSASLHMVAAHAIARKSGVGTKLIKKAFKEAIKAGKREINLWCVDDPQYATLVRYYEKLGFKKTEKAGIYDSAYIKEEFHGKLKVTEMTRTIDHDKVTYVPFTE